MNFEQHFPVVSDHIDNDFVGYNFVQIANHNQNFFDSMNFPDFVVDIAVVDIAVAHIAVAHIAVVDIAVVDIAVVDIAVAHIAVVDIAVVEVVDIVVVDDVFVAVVVAIAVPEKHLNNFD